MADAQTYTSKLHSARVLIIGGSSGIGFSVAEACLENGCTVILSSSSHTRIESAISRLHTSYPSAKSSARVTGHPCDLSTASTLESNIQALFEKVGTVDHIVYTAGDKLAIIPLAEATLEKVQQAGMVRFFAPLLVAKHAVSHLSPGPAASLTLTTGTVSEKPIAGWSVVAPYAGGLHSMMRNLALDLKPIRVNLISPGAVETELWDSLGKEEFEALKEGHRKKSATGQIGQPGDVAEAYLYVMRDRNITGSVISTNGGALVMSS
ncbi:hypothetical protein MMC08_004854 [Hypocenomyce scalaris]|nr:hypothetical protein [Hypocenomyce scalaris]